MSQKKFWDNKWNEFEADKVCVADFATAFEKKPWPGRKMLLDLIGDIKGKDVLEIGCGNGLLSVYLAQKGANVTAIDNSIVSVTKTEELIKYNKADSMVKAYKLDAMEIDKLGRVFDVVIGEHVLHHIGLFSIFAKLLFKIIKKNGQGVFLENNNRNPMLMFARNFLAGKYGIPKYGDDEEFPFGLEKIKTLKQNFNIVNTYYPEFIFFTLADTYIFRSPGIIRNVLFGLDKWLYRNFPSFHKYSYSQIVELKK
ncbi:MAG: methyltransferase domain-containing protein [Elusimicrobia bacterium]|nr:methyltransferase domain-containing protein [Elusimicrobiota bacterium]